MSVFKAIPFMTEYAVSPFGDVVSLKHKNKPSNRSSNRFPNGKIKCFLNERYYNVDYLVASTWVENPNHHTHVKHLDGNESNNDVSNLEWVS